MSKFNGHSTAELRARSEEIAGALTTADLRIAALARDLSDLKAHRHELNQERQGALSEIERRTRPAPEPKISEHALLRYIERVLQVNLDELRDHILTPRIKDAIRAGASSVKIDGVTFAVSGGSVTTVLAGEMREPRKKAPRYRETDEDMSADGEAVS